MSDVDYRWQERGPQQKPPPDHEDFETLQKFALASTKKRDRRGTRAYRRARRWARAWKWEARGLSATVEMREAELKDAEVREARLQARVTELEEGLRLFINARSWDDIFAARHKADALLHPTESKTP